MEATGDYAGASLLPFYQCARAVIRGMAALLLSIDENAESSRRDLARAEALRHLDHALEYTRVTDGHLIVMCGPSGAGKSTIARKLATRTGSIHIRSDAVRKHLAGVDLTERDESIYSESYTNATYAKMIEHGILLAKRGRAVILDAKFDCRDFRSKLIHEAAAFDLPLLFVYCHAPSEVLKHRLIQRVGDVSDATERLVESQTKQFQFFNTKEEEIVISLDTQDNGAVAAVQNELERRLECQIEGS